MYTYQSKRQEKRLLSPIALRSKSNKFDIVFLNLRSILFFEPTGLFLHFLRPLVNCMGSYFLIERSVFRVRVLLMFGIMMLVDLGPSSLLKCNQLNESPDKGRSSSSHSSHIRQRCLSTLQEWRYYIQHGRSTNPFCLEGVQLVCLSLCRLRI